MLRSCGEAPSSSASRTSDRPALTVIAQGAKVTSLNGREFAYGPGQFVNVSVELPVIGHIVQASADGPFLAFVLELRPERIAALLLETAPAATLRTGAIDAARTTTRRCAQ